MNELRSIIKECIAELLEDSNSDSQEQLSKDSDNIEKSIKLAKQDIKNMDTRLKMDTITKNKLNATNPDRKGLEVSLPLRQDDIDKRKEDIEKLQNAKKAVDDASQELTKQNNNTSTTQTSTSTTNTTTNSSLGTLPTIQVPI